MTRATIAAGVMLTLAVSTPALAQGKSPQKKPGGRPSHSDLTAAPMAASATSATPLAWVDDASLLAPGTMAFSISAMRWQGSGLSEVDAPIIDAAFGLVRRVQLSANVPRIVGGPDGTDAQGGLGTSFFSAKIGVYEAAKHGFKVAASPTLQLLGSDVVATTAPASRARWGLPVSAEVSSGATRLYGGGGYFSPGLWFAGAAVGFGITDKTSASVGVSRAWRSTEAPEVPIAKRDRQEISGGAVYMWRPRISAFGSVGRTFATLDENGAGTSISGGLSIFFDVPSHRP